MGLSLREAARESGKSKSTILRAIQSGRLSATRTDDGGWSVDPAELFRVYAPGGAPQGRDASPSGTGATVADAQVSALREIIERMDRQMDDLREDRDHWRVQAESANRRLTDASAPVSWWKRLVG